MFGKEIWNVHNQELFSLPFPSFPHCPLRIALLGTVMAESYFLSYYELMSRHECSRAISGAQVVTRLIFLHYAAP